MRRARLGGAGAVLVGGNEPRDDGLERVGLGGGQRLQRFEPWCCERRRGYCSWRPRRGRGRRWLCGGCGLRGCGDDTGRGGGDCSGSTGETHLFEQMAARDIAGRTAPVVVVGHDVLPSVFLSCSMVHPAFVCRKHTLVVQCKLRPSPAGLTRGSIILRQIRSRRGWIAGSSPAMTEEGLFVCAQDGQSRAASMPSRMLTRTTCRSRICGNGRRARTAVTQDQHEETPCGHLPGLPRHDRSCARVSSRPLQRHWFRSSSRPSLSPCPPRPPAFQAR